MFREGTQGDFYGFTSSDGSDKHQSYFQFSMLILRHVLEVMLMRFPGRHEPHVHVMHYYRAQSDECSTNEQPDSSDKAPAPTD
jgi:hypothetical protein